MVPAVDRRVYLEKISFIGEPEVFKMLFSYGSQKTLL